MTHTQIFFDGNAAIRPSVACRHVDGRMFSLGCRWGASNALTVFGTFAEVGQFVSVLQRQLDSLRPEPAGETEVSNALPY